MPLGPPSTNIAEERFACERQSSGDWPREALRWVRASPGRSSEPEEVAMRFIGLDLHKRLLVICAIDRRGKVLFRESIECRREVLEAFAKSQLRKTDRLAVEATTN